MSFTVYETITIDERFKRFIQSGNYEEFILDLMNSSTKIFPNQYKHIVNQSHGETDFVDLKTYKKYDAKLPFTTEQGKLIGSNNSDYIKWVKSMYSELFEFGTYINNRGQYTIEQLTLYKIIKKRINVLKLDENLILFFPFPIAMDGSEMIFTRFAGDILSMIFSALKNNGIVKKRMIYAIYPCLDKEIVIRCLNNNEREYFSSDKLGKYIEYEMRI